MATVMAFHRHGYVAAEKWPPRVVQAPPICWQILDLTALPTLALLVHTTNSCPNLKFNVCLAEDFSVGLGLRDLGLRA